MGTLIPDVKQEILLITEPGKEEEAITRMARVGFDHCLGYLNGGFTLWETAGKEINQLVSVKVSEAPDAVASEKGLLLDVRRRSEFEGEHVDGVINAPLDYIKENIQKIDRTRPILVHCAGGYRNVIFNSILQSRGYRNFINVKGGFKAIKERGLFKITDFVEQATQLQFALRDFKRGGSKEAALFVGS